MPRLLLAPVLLSLLSACGVQEVQEGYARRLMEGTPARVVVESFQGPVRLEASAGGVDVAVDKRARAVTPSWPGSPSPPEGGAPAWGRAGPPTARGR